MNFAKVVVFATSILCFLPYPAVPVGNVTGLQAFFFIAPTLFVYALTKSESVGSLISFSSLLAAYIASGLIALFNNSAIIPTNTFKAVPVILLSVMPIVCFAPFLVAKYRQVFFLAVASSILLHSALGFVQWVQFAQGAFPLMWLYENNSFALVDPSLVRPMGLFPEPSAMAAVVGPFLLLQILLLLDRRLRNYFSRSCRIFMSLSSFAGLVLLTLSKSGFILPFALILGAVVIVGLPVWGATSLLARLSIYGVVIIVSAVVGVYVWGEVEERFTAEYFMTGSWAGRLDSIIEALRIWISRQEYFLFGVGANQGHLHMEQTGTYQNYVGMTRFGAVYSILFTYVLEAGLFAVSSILIVGVQCFTAIRRGAFAIGGYAACATWFAAISITTSYFILPGIWLFLAVLINWDRLFPPIAQDHMSRYLSN